MTGSHETAQTPGGATLTINRWGKWSTVRVDRWRIDDGTNQQRWWAEGVATAAGYSCFARGRTTSVETTIGPVDWEAMCPREDEAALTQAFVAIERNDFTPVARYIKDRAWADAPTYRRWIAGAAAHEVAAGELPAPALLMPARQALAVQRRIDRSVEVRAMLRPTQTIETIAEEAEHELSLLCATPSYQPVGDRRPFAGDNARHRRSPVSR